MKLTGSDAVLVPFILLFIATTWLMLRFTAFLFGETRRIVSTRRPSPRAEATAFDSLAGLRAAIHETNLAQDVTYYGYY
jgi:hypothetical protein